MQIVTLIFLTVYMLVLVRKKNVITPGVIFPLIFGGAFFLSGLHLSFYQSTYPIWFYLLMYLLIFIFEVAYKGANDSLTKKSERNLQAFRDYDSETFKLIVILLWISILVSFLITVIKLGVPPLLNYAVDRSDYFLSGFGTILALSPLLFCLLLYDRYSKRVLNNSCYIIYLSTLLVIVVLMANKFEIFEFLILWIAINAIMKKGQSFMTIVWLVIIAVVIFVILYSTVYVQMYNFTVDQANYYYGMNLPEQFSFIVYPYLYIAGNFENLYHFMISDSHLMWGYKTLYNITRDVTICNLIYPNSISMYSNEFTNSLHWGTLNTGTLFVYSYHDFGVLGMVMSSMFIGAWSGYVGIKYKLNGKFFWLFTYLLTIVSLFLAFFTDMFTAKSTIVNIVVAWIVSKIIYTRVRIIY